MICSEYYEKSYTEHRTVVIFSAEDDAGEIDLRLKRLDPKCERLKYKDIAFLIIFRTDHNNTMLASWLTTAIKMFSLPRSDYCKKGYKLFIVPPPNVRGSLTILIPNFVIGKTNMMCYKFA